MQHFPLLGVIFVNFAGARWLACLDCGFSEFQKADLVDRVFVAATDLAVQVYEPLFDAVQIGEHEFGLDDFGVFNRVNAPFDMGDVVVFKAAQHVGDGVAFTDVSEELVAEPFALGCTFDEARNVDECHARWDDGFRGRNGGQFIKPSVRHTDVAHVGFNSAKREVGGLCGCGFRQRVKQG